MPAQQPGPIPGSYWVRPGLLAGPYPGSWDERATYQRVRALLEAGVTHVLDLTEPGEADPYALYLPPAVRYQRFPIPDMHTPTDEEMVAILDSLDAALAEGRQVYLHCLGGIGRTGTVVGCYLARHGTVGEAALEAIQRLRGGLFDSPQTETQRAMVRSWPAER